MQLNIEILNCLEIHPKYGSSYWVQDLLDKGFEFTVCSTTGKLHNYPRNKGGNYSVYGNYRIYRRQNDEVLIKNMSNLNNRNHD